MTNVKNLSGGTVLQVGFHTISPRVFFGTMFWTGVRKQIHWKVYKGFSGKNVQKSPYLDNEFLEVAKPKQDSNYFPV
jgi:hypothetical protein